MNQHLKHLMGAVAALMLMSGPALACSGKSCSAKQCDYKAGHAQSRACGNNKCAMNKPRHANKGHARIPGKTSNYIHKILEKGELIGLTGTQRRQITDLLAKAETGAAGAGVQITALAAAFYDKLRSGGVDDDEIKAYTQRMGELHAAHLQANLMASVHAAALLSDGQKATLYADQDPGAGEK